MKTRILFCGEATYLSTGYSTYGKELLSRLYQMPEFEIAEFASYAAPKEVDKYRRLVPNPHLKDIPWKVYCNAPSEDDTAAVKEYMSKPTNKFGEWKFEQVCLDFKPHIVVDIRDWWMMEYQQRSPFRPYYKWVIMPTVDSEPQNEQWLSTFADAEGVFTYSDWGFQSLQEQAGKHLNLLGRASPSANEVYKPVKNKDKHRSMFGFEDDIVIVGTIMRNQRRKLYPDLFESFRKFIDQTGDNNTYLYCHTTYPDLGWDIPKYIKKFGLSSRIIMTYKCKACGYSFPTFFRDSVTYCGRCNQMAALPISVKNGVSQQILSDIINTFDVYIQYANSEGFGMPQVEAAACGVPVMSVDYSAMSSVVRKLNGYPLKVKSFTTEPETGCRRAQPDNDYLAQKLAEFVVKPKAMKRREGHLARLNFEKHYQWDAACKKWADFFSSLTIPDDKYTWNSKPKYFTPSNNIPTNVSNERFVRWLITDVLGQPEMLDSYMELRLIRDLNYGQTLGGTGGLYFNENSQMFSKTRYEDFDREIAYNHMSILCGRRNYWEKKRVESI